MPTPLETNVELLAKLVGIMAEDLSSLHDGFVQAQIPVAALADGVADLDAVIRTLDTGFDDLYDRIGETAKATQEQIKAIRDHGQSLTQLRQHSLNLAALLSGKLPVAIAQLASAALGAVPGLGGLASLSTGFIAVGSAIGSLVQNLNPELFQVLTNTIQLSLMPALSALAPVIGTALGFFAKIGVIVEALSPALQDLATAMAPVVDAFLDVGLTLLNVVGRAFLLLGQVLASVLKAFEPAMDFLVGMFGILGTVIQRATPIIVDFTTKAIEHLGGFLKGIVSDIVGFLDAFANGLIGAVNAIIRGINSLLAQVGLEGFGEIGRVNIKGGFDDFLTMLAEVTEEGKRLRGDMNRGAQGRMDLALASMGPKGGLQDIGNVWMKMMNASLGESPQERAKRNQQFQTTMLVKMSVIEAMMRRDGLG